jgi:hypothetical protein
LPAQLDDVPSPLPTCEQPDSVVHTQRVDRTVNASRRWIIWVIVGAALLLVWIAVPLIVFLGGAWQRGRPRQPLPVRLDDREPYLILSTQRATTEYAEAIGLAKELHPNAMEGLLATEDLASTRRLLATRQPCYVLVFLLPDELDVNFAWRWLELTTEVDDDPFVDVRTGFITGESSEAVTDFVRRIREAVQGRLKLPGAFVDNLGPNPMARKSAFNKAPQNPMIPVLGKRLGASTISHGTQAFAADRLGSMSNAGLLHFGGHGYPDRIEDGLLGRQVRDLELSPCVVFSGACYTGVTGRWYDVSSGTVEKREVTAEESFGLGILRSNVIGYLAALHADHGIPVYQEMEYMATAGASLGDIIKHTHDGVVLGAGGKLPDLPELEEGMDLSGWTPADFMLRGTAARVLFGDPALILTDAFTDLPFDIALQPGDEQTLKLKARLRNPALRSTFTDTYYSDLSATGQFNDRALIVCELPKEWETVGSVEVMRVQAGGEALRHGLVGFAVEEDDGTRWLHVQVDLPSTGYMQSAFRRAGADVELVLRP